MPLVAGCVESLIAKLAKGLRVEHKKTIKFSNGTEMPADYYSPKKNKYTPESFDAAEYIFPEPVDPFSEWAVPPFPLECLPKAIRDFAIEESAGSGFDAGGYAVCALASLSGLIDQQTRLAATASWKEPPMLWLGIVSQSGSGKSPVIRSGMQFSKKIDKELQQSSMQATQSWRGDNAGKKKDDRDPQPPWQQLIVTDTTVEALANVLADNPRGVLVHADELTRWIGSMDCYAGKGADRDRGCYLEAYDGGPRMINRAVKGNTFLRNWSVAILGGIQPEKLAAMFNQSHAAASDGLYQRFLVYCLQPAHDFDVFAKQQWFSVVNLQRIADEVNEWSMSGRISESHPELTDDAKHAFQVYCNALRELQSRTPESRFAEHLGKYPGMVLRLTLTLHCIERAAEGQWSHEVGLETFIRAQTIMACLYRHSEAAYSKLSENVRSERLLQSIASAILAKTWAIFTYADLTRHCKPWRDCKTRLEREDSLSKLVEMGWLHDVTEVSAGVGRRPQGKFLVNPLVHTMFSDVAEQAAEDRARRHAAIQLAGIARHQAKGQE